MFFVSEEGRYEPRLGDYLGQLTNQIQNSKGNYISEATFIAEKFYAYKTDFGHTHAICKGIAFNHITAIQVTFETLKKMVIEDTSKQIEIEQLKFIRNTKNWTIKTEIGSKT